ncbi:hypothetical protein FXV83_23325 [Bradyrhizobium hipponense]|uniref:Uncharacterized protein n=1 Tax=Bradyrhizobium hipponense TaxID=2605638 RepID=A0A5S4YJQ9_9BRAD|nr:hypothetical protein [Bradyrhizobium hipponense]TYO64293.1 hypothetical protein FXV83_23325 [Bradyrhizobium hipponense]
MQPHPFRRYLHIESLTPSCGDLPILQTTLLQRPPKRYAKSTATLTFSDTGPEHTVSEGALF